MSPLSPLAHRAPTCRACHLLLLVMMVAPLHQMCVLAGAGDAPRFTQLRSDRFICADAGGAAQSSTPPLPPWRKLALGRVSRLLARPPPHDGGVWGVSGDAVWAVGDDGSVVTSTF